MANEHKDSGGRSGWHEASLALALPTLMVTGPILGYFLGLWLARWFDFGETASFWSRVVGVLLGTAAGVRETIKLIRRISKSSK